MTEVRLAHLRALGLADAADVQHGVISAAQLRALGHSTSAIHRHVAARRLRRLFRGVYAVGHESLTPEGRWLAAVLACGPRAALSRRDAAALWGMRPIGARSFVEVTVSGGAGRRPRAGLRVHRSETLLPEQVVVHRGIPVTTPERTLADLALVAPRHVVLRATEQAELRGLLARDPQAQPPTRSDLEAAFLTLCDDFEIPRPSVNVAVGPYTVDFLWPRERVIVETDHHHTHSSRLAFNEDRARGVWLAAGGHHLIRVSDEQVFHRPQTVATAVLRALRLG